MQNRFPNGCISLSSINKLVSISFQDGSEGIFFKFMPDTDYAPTGNIIIGDDDD